MQYTTSEQQFKPAPEGTFQAKITDVSEWSNPNGQNKLIVEFTFNNPDTLDEIKKKEFVNPVISQGDGFRVFADLISLVHPDIEPEGEFNEKELLNKECEITIKHTEGKGRHEGKVFSNVVMVLPVKKNTK